MSLPIAYGIDLGTTNSSIAAAFADRVDVLKVESGSMPESLRSVIYLGRNGNELAGNAAIERYLIEGARKTWCGSCPLVDRFGNDLTSSCKLFRIGGGCQNARILSGIKGHLWHNETKLTHSWAQDFTLDGLVAILLGRLKSEADRALGARVQRVVLGYPVAFVGTEGPEYGVRQARAEQRLRDAAELAGFTEIELYPEPAAAAIDETLDRGFVLSLDFGGGTFDAAVIEYSEGGAETIALKGTAIGGEMFDEELFAAKVARQLGLTGRDVPNWLRDGMRSLSGVTHLLGDPRLYPAIASLKGRPGCDGLAQLEELLYGGQAYRFYKAIEDAKVALSSKATTTISFHRRNLSIEAPVHRDEFENLIGGHMRKVEAVILDALGQAGVEPGQIDVVLRTGGSSRIPMFVRFLEAAFGASKVLERDAFTTVAHGLGVFAQEQWAA